MNVYVYHFSPTGTTERIATSVGRTLDPHARIVRLAESELLANRGALEALGFGESEVRKSDAFAVFAVPVFAGRVPRPAAEALACIRGNGVRAASIVVYGNRDFDDALVELNDILEQQGFRVMASAAFVAQHSMQPPIAAGRPDDADLSEAESFAQSIVCKLAAPGADDGVAVPGNRPYKESPAAAWVPTVSDDCTLCGTCASRCPAQAIPLDAPNTTDARCFQCMRCVAVCPEGARSLPAPVAAMIAEKLAPLANVRKPNQMWL